MAGWIKLHRSLLEHELWKDKPFTKGQAWIDLIFLADTETKTKICHGKLKTFERGKVYKSILELSERWGWSRGRTTRFLKNLENDTTVRIESSTTDGTTITIVNYGVYQDKRTAKRATNGQQPEKPADNKADIPKEDKNIIHKKKEEKKKEEERRKEGGGGNPFAGERPAKGTPEYERWKNQ